MDKSTIHADSENNVPQLSGEDALDTAIGAGASNAIIEDCIYYADIQYVNNTSAGLQSMENTDDVVHTNVDIAPAQAIRKGPLRFLWGPTSPEVVQHHVSSEATAPQSEKQATTESNDEKNSSEKGMNQMEAQATTAARDTVDRLVLRRVTMMRCFFLITCDVLGPFQGPYVYSQVGYVPATLVYITMGVMAYLAGLNLNVMYLRLDSDKMPVRNYGYLVKRIWGTYGKIITDFFFIVQLIFQCGQLLLTNAQSLGLIIDGANGGRNHVCFTVLVVVFMVINMLCSPIRSLKSISLLSQFSLFLAIASIIMSISFIYSSGTPYAIAAQAYGPAFASGPVVTSAIASLPLTARVNGIMNMVYAYGGAMIFVDIYAEMKRPWDFWKSSLIAQAIIMAIYLITGIVVYARQGQFVQSLFYFGVDKYSYQTVGNVIGVYTGLIAAILYGNIAQKELYYIVVRGYFKGPGLMTRQGYKWWLLGNFIVWALAFVIGSAIPQVQTVSGIIAAIAVMQFSYNFPFLLKLTFDIQVDAMKGDRPYAPGDYGSTDHRIDTWRQWSRWRRGLFTGNVYSKAFFAIIGLGAIAMSGLGIYGSAESIVATFKAAPATSFGCVTP